MTKRYYPFILSAALLAGLNACSTTAPVSVEQTAGEPDLQTETDDSKAGDLQSQALQNPSDRNLQEIQALSTSMSEYQPDLALEILRSLESVSSGQINAMIAGQTQDPEFTEWLELALQIRTTMIHGSSVTTAAKYWTDFHYGHAIAQDEFRDLVFRYNALFSAPSQVAILLPTEGGFASAAKAIRDGMLSAYLEKPGNSAIRFYASGQSSQSAIDAYLQASEDGATQIVGPLRIESTRALASMENLSIPVLLLNESSDSPPFTSDPNVVVNSLSLSQTEEATAIAEKALDQGYGNAIVIVPDTAWGTRIASAFATAFENGDGNISATARFITTMSDHSLILTQLLKIDESMQRKASLQSRLGIPLTFEPSRRDDFDFIFLAANAAQGRELKPLLRFHNVGDVPVYAMGRIYSGKSAQASDRDLDGIVFPTTPWQIQAADSTELQPASLRDGALGNLYALGQDAWRMLPWLPLMQKDPDLWFPGDVGALRLEESGRLYRSPAWAQFSGGRPISYQWPSRH